MSSECSGTLQAHHQDPDDNEYATPPEIWRPLARAVDGFDTDPASGAESTPIASTRYTKEDDGLSKAWDGWTEMPENAHHPADESPQLRYCNRCVGDTLHCWEGDHWSCNSCGQRWSA